MTLADRQRRPFGCEPQLTSAGVGSGPDDWLALSMALAEIRAHLQVPVIGISGSQGSGKSTLAAVIVSELQARGLAAVAASLDDFYLTRAARAELAREVHPLLQTRGVPGTHDHAWLAQVLTAIHDGQQRLRLPRFDKGTDDRADEQQVQAQVLVLEGWCLGVTAQPEQALRDPINALEAAEDSDGRWRQWVNRQIAAHYEPLWAQVDLWVHLRAPDFSVVEAWRRQQEQDLPPDRRMDAAALGRFVAHYERLTRWQLACRPPGPGIVAELDADRGVTQVTIAASGVL